MIRFTDESMLTVMHSLREQVDAVEAGGVIGFEVLNPDVGVDAYAGKRFTVEGHTHIYRGYKAWTDLAELLFCKMLTPEKLSESVVRLRFQKLNTADSFHHSTDHAKAEKYGTASRFFAIDKTEEPAFMDAYVKALGQVKLGERMRVLNLGINTGNEFEVIRAMMDEEAYKRLELVGIDHSVSAIDFARERFPEPHVTFHAHDINRLDTLKMERFDVIVSIGTLQSPGIEFKPLFMSLVQHYLSDNGAVILGFPNCRWMGGEMIYGAKAPNYAFSEQSLLYKDVHFCKKYLQQKKFRVMLTGKPYLFLTAIPIGG